MEEAAENFVAQFHNLEGLTVAEKKRNLFHLFNKNRFVCENNHLQDLIASRLVAETHLENLFRVEFLIHYRRFDELFREFLNGDGLVLRKIAKQKWFLVRAFEGAGPDFVTQNFPNLSHSSKLKILNKMSAYLSETQSDRIFGTLLAHYGLCMASNLLTSCSTDTIERVLKKYPVRLRHKQLKLLFDKSPKLVRIYLEERVDFEASTKFMNNNPIMPYIARKNPDFYCELLQKYSFEASLGKRVSKKFIVAKREEIIAKPELYVKSLKPARLIRQMGPDFKAIFSKLFPRRIQDSPSSQSSRLLKFYPKTKRYALLTNTFNQIFPKTIEESPHLIDSYILDMIQNPDEREKLAKIKHPNEPQLEYCRIDRCFEAVKQQINLTKDPDEHARSIETLVECCIINDDYSTLLEALKFATERFKDDGDTIMQTLAETLICRNCNFEKLAEDHWNYIGKFELDALDSTGLKLFLKHLEFLAKTGKSINAEISSFFQTSEFHHEHTEFLRDNPRVEKEFLCAAVTLAPNFCDSVENSDCRLILACQKYNKRNPKNPINIHVYPRLAHSLKNALISGVGVDNNLLSQALEAVICTKYRSEEIEELITHYWANWKTPKGVGWFLKHRPEIIQKHFREFLLFATEDKNSNNAKTWKVLKNYSHMNFDRNAIELFVSCDFKNRSSIAEPLSILMQPQEFLGFFNDSVTENLRECFLKARKNIETVEALAFIRENEAHSCLAPFYKLPENSIKPFINELNNKHACFLSAALLSADDVLKILKLCDLKQSVRASFKYFRKNPSQAIWDIFKNKLACVSEQDKTLLNLLTRKPVPKDYKAEHFKIIWEIVNRFNSNRHKIILLDNLQVSTLSQLPQDFLENLIRDNIFVIKNLDANICNYLLASQHHDKVRIVFRALEKIKTTPTFSKAKLHDFVNTFFRIYMESEISDIDLVTSFASNFEQLFPYVGTFEESILLFVLKFKNQDLDNLSKSIIELHHNLILQYGENTVEIFAECLQKILAHFCPDNVTMYKFYHIFLNSGQSIEDILLLIKLLPLDSEPEDRQSLEYYNLTLSQLQGMNFDSVQLALNLHFKYRKVILNHHYYTISDRTRYMSPASWLTPGAFRRVF